MQHFSVKTAFKVPPRLFEIALFTALAFCQIGCGPGEPEKTSIELGISIPSELAPAGTTPLDLGSTLFINRGFAWRDGLLHVPAVYSPDAPAPLLVWLHGGGGHARDAQGLFPIADEFGVVVLALDSRHNTWDGIDSRIGPDVRFIEQALHYVAKRVAIDRDRLALGGLSDGGTYALALGRSNGDLFTHLIAVSPWRMQPPAPVSGEPRIFIAHGLKDTVYPEWHSRRVVVPAIEKAGYDVSYFPFDGPHWVTEEVGRAIMRWLRHRRPAAVPTASSSQQERR